MIEKKILNVSSGGNHKKTSDDGKNEAASDLRAARRRSSRIFRERAEFHAQQEAEWLSKHGLHFASAWRQEAALMYGKGD